MKGSRMRDTALLFTSYIPVFSTHIFCGETPGEEKVFDEFFA